MRWLVLLLLGQGYGSFAASKSLNFSCRAESLDGPLIVHHGTETFVLSEFVFPETSFVDPGVFCKRWLRETLNTPTPKGYHEKISLEVQTLAGSAGDPAARLVGPARSLLYSACRRSPICSLRFPYQFLGLENADAWESLQESIFKSAPILPHCRRQLRRSPKVQVTPSSAPVWNFGTETKWWVTPQTSFLNELLEELKKPGATRFLVSSMTVSRSSVEEISETLKSYPLKEVFLIFSLPHVLAEEDLENSVIGQDRPPNLFLLPAFPSAARPRNYHIKGFVSDKDAYSFTSANIASTHSQASVDLGFSGTDPQKASYFRDLFLNEAELLCQDEISLSCSMEAALSPRHPHRFLIQELVSSACRHLPKFQGVRKAGFLQSATHDFPQWLIAEMHGAIHQSIIFSHQFGHNDVLKAFEALPPQVHRHLWVGAPQMAREMESMATESETDIRWNTNRRYLQPHSKGMLIDDRRLVMCTGNFSRNGLEDSTEACFATESPPAIAAAQKYLATASDYLTKGKPLPLLFPSRVAAETLSIFVPADSVRNESYVKNWIPYLQNNANGLEDFFTPKLPVQPVSCLPKEARFFDVIDSLARCSVPQFEHNH